MKRALVTGGTGFVGRTLCPVLVESGYTVRLSMRRTGAVTLAGVEEWIVEAVKS